MPRPSSLPELCQLITASATASRTLRLVGRGTWLEGGAPVREGAEPLHLDAFDGVIEYEPGDLTITVGAATTIAQLDAVTAQHGQWCPLSPWGGDNGSVGATIATATTGPYSLTLGRPRDLVLGLECVDGTGKVLRPGGKVVKNVAGFDVTRLITGSWGSLAAITRVSLRLRARPSVDESWTVAIDASRADSAAQALRQAATPPIACEVLDEAAAFALGSGVAPGLLVRIAGNGAYVAAARSAVAVHGDTRAVDPHAWLLLRSAHHPRFPRTPLAAGVRALNDRVKAAFDPADILNPGIMG